MKEHYSCELCNRVWSSVEEYYNHLSKHTRKELMILKFLEQLAMRSPEKFEELQMQIWELLFRDARESEERKELKKR
jgi:hypothetical protein